MRDMCEVCHTEIKMMVRRGTGLCSENCQKIKNQKTPISKETP